ncbi:MAG: dephospho-CoA kinase, partial [Eubacteriales bacterium]
MKQNNRPYIIGITGGIASGKTLVSRLLKDLGAKVLNADEITHQLYEAGGKGTALIAEHFGEEYIGEHGVDRKKLGQMVFSDSQALNDLNALIHPLILQELLDEIDEDDGFVFFEAAVLVESKIIEEMDEVWLVICELDERIRRLKLRDDIDDEKIE